jgi:hypothetical protein
VIVLDVSDDALEGMIRGVGATPKIGEDALRSALGKTMRWANTRARRAVAGGAKIAQGVLSRDRRFFLRLPRTGDPRGSIWIGLAPVSASHLKPRQTSSGVSAGAHRFPGAFLASGRKGRGGGAGGARLVWKRRGKERLPIDKQAVSIADAATAALSGDVFRGIEDFFVRTFEHEMRWRMSRA